MTAPQKYEYDPFWPRYDTLTPSDGTSRGGTTVTIAGEFFTEGASGDNTWVKFADQKALDVQVKSDKEIVCVTPEQKGKESLFDEDVEITGSMNGKLIFPDKKFTYTCDAKCIAAQIVRRFWWAVALVSIIGLCIILYIVWRFWLKRRWHRDGRSSSGARDRKVEMQPIRN